MAGRFIGLDVGQKRTGIAVASAAAKLAQPHSIIDTRDVVTAIGRLDKEEKIDAIIVGLPRSLDGEDTAQTGWVKQWVSEAKKKLGPPLFWQDEALTTSIAQERQPKSSRLDAEAASIILQDWLDSDEQTRVNC